MQSAYDILFAELPATVLRRPQFSGKLLRTGLKRNRSISQAINNYTQSHPVKEISLKTRFRSVRLESELLASPRSPIKASFSTRLDDFMQKLKKKRQKPKRVLQVSVNNCSTALDQGPVVIKNATNRGQSKWTSMSRAPVLGHQKQNRNRSRLHIQALQQSSSHFRVHHVLTDKFKHQKLSDIVEAGQFSARTIDLLRSIKLYF